MKLLLLLLVCCSALWVEAASSSIVKALPPSCDSLLALSSSVSSSSEGNRDIYRRSLSPWTWRSSTDSNRIPSTLWEAECSSSFCFSPNKQTDRHNLNSVPVLQNVLVLTRSSKGLCYTASYRSVAVGCTCVWARIHHT
ncbi:interleukin 17a/f2 [Pseudochaenichthys georgianus]|uniref:interleukin 17a/f2 n=1 Tax=Pseudochaenichthys georgianus TaxID=52239 RepID=UPI00146EAADD|nr:interleukin 17a/f2 [Pseudochaenichthys georgianus]